MSLSRARVVDLFCGAGGFSLGFRAAGATILAGVDHDAMAMKTFSRNISALQPDGPPACLCEDLSHLEAHQIQMASPDILIGGPPCQGFSRVGRARLARLKGHGALGDPRNKLYKRFILLMAAWRPKAVIIENVPGMMSVEGIDVAEEVGTVLTSHGYRVGQVILNAAHHGVPQFRERLFFIALRSDLGLEPEAPRATHRVNLPSGYLRMEEAGTIPFEFMGHYRLPVLPAPAQEPATTVRDALGDLPRLQEHLEHEQKKKPLRFPCSVPYGGPPVTRYAALMREWPGLPAPGAMDDHVARRTPRDYSIFAAMKPGDRYPEAIEIATRLFEQEIASRRAAGELFAPGTGEYNALKKKIVPGYPLEQFVDKWRKFIPDAPSWTVTAHLSKDTYSHIHYDSEQSRMVSVREAGRLQSFPDGYAFEGNMGERFGQIGNAVPPLLSWAIAATVLRQLGFAWTPPPLPAPRATRPAAIEKRHEGS